MTVVEKVTSLTDSELKTIVSFSHAAFAGDPFMNALLGGNVSLLDDLTVTTMKATLLEGELYIVRDETGTIASVASWFPRNKGLFSTEAQRNTGYADLFTKLDPQTQHFMRVTYPQAIEEATKDMWTPDECERMSWCYNLATAPYAQRRGYATALLDHKTKEAHAKDDLVGLAAVKEDNAQFYLSLGFEKRGQLNISPPLTDNFTCYIFSKHAK